MLRSTWIEGRGGGAVKSVKKPDLHRCTRFPSQFSNDIENRFCECYSNSYYTRVYIHQVKFVGKKII